MPPDRNAPTGTSAIMRRADGVAQKRIERLDRLAAVDPVAAALRDHVLDPPIAFDHGLTAGARCVRIAPAGSLNTLRNTVAGAGT